MSWAGRSLTRFSAMLEAITLEKVLGFIGKHWPYAVIAVLTAALLWSRHDLGNAREKLAAEATFRHSLAGILGTKAEDPSSLLGVASARMKESADRGQTLKTISDQALKNKQAADAADAELKREQADNARKFAAAQAQIAALQGHKSTGNKDADMKQIEIDTQAPWKGWK